MKKISIFMPSLRGGGMERSLLLLSHEFVKRGVAVDLVVINTIDSAYSPNPGINLIDLKARQIRFALRPLIKYLRTEQPQVIFSAGTPLNSLLIITRMLTGLPKRLVVSERNDVSTYSKNSVRLGDRLRPWLVRYLYPLSDLIVTVSKGVADDLIDTCSIDPRKIRTIHNMFDTRKIIVQSESLSGLSWLDSEAIPVIINIGRLRKQKDQATLLEAFAILRSKKECRLVILGEGEERANLEQLARRLGVDDDVCMPGFVSNPFSYVSRAKVFVLSSAWEGLPGVLIEALACGTPVVSTDCPSGPAEILDNGTYGTLTPVGDAAALADAMLQTLKVHPSVDMLRQRAMDFSIEKIIPQYLESLISVTK